MACAMVCPWAGSQNQRAQDQHVQRALENVSGFGRSFHDHERSLHSNDYAKE